MRKGEFTVGNGKCARLIQIESYVLHHLKRILIAFAFLSLNYPPNSFVSESSLIRLEISHETRVLSFMKSFCGKKEE